MVKTGTTAEPRRRPCLRNGNGLVEKIKIWPLDGAVAGTYKAVRSLWAQGSWLQLHKGVLYWQWEETNKNPVTRWLIAPQILIQDVLKVLHNRVLGGYLAIHETLSKVCQHFDWPGLQEDVERCCQQCLVCAQSKSPIATSQRPLVPSQLGFPMETIALDNVDPLPTSKWGNKYILVIIDYFTHWAEAYSLPDQEAATVV